MCSTTRSIEIPYEYVLAAKRSRELVHMFEQMDPMDQSQQILWNSEMAISYNKAKLYLRHYQDEYYNK